MKVFVTYDIDIPDKLLTKGNEMDSAKEVVFDCLEQRALISLLEMRTRIETKGYFYTEDILTVARELYDAEIKMIKDIKMVEFKVQ